MQPAFKIQSAVFLFCPRWIMVDYTINKDVHTMAKPRDKYELTRLSMLLPYKLVKWVSKI